MSFTQEVLCEALQHRRLLCKNVADALQHSLLKANKNTLKYWTVRLGDNLLFDLAGLQAITQVIQTYHGNASLLKFKLQASKECIRDYYSHSNFVSSDNGDNDDSGDLVDLPIIATKLQNESNNNSEETLVISLDELSTAINYPLSLTPPDTNQTPLALLLPYSCDHDLLFANQIAVFSSLNNALKKSPFHWIKGMFKRRNISLKRRISLGWKQIHTDTDIHPTAIIEGSVIAKGCRIGAYCVVRYSVLGEHVVLHDGAKVEYSVVDNHSWLMHDLVLYRSLTEEQVFLIHGPYQFSYFQKQSAAFANIMMDYRPDNKPIRIQTPQGIKDYKGRFLGALLKEKARVFGGTLTVPGITIPQGKEVYCHIDAITTPKNID